MKPLPEKPWHRIGEVAKWLDLEPHVLRHWETEFAAHFGQIEYSPKGQRIYRRRQLVLFATIRELLYTELYTIAGAKRQLRLAAERERERQAG